MPAATLLPAAGVWLIIAPLGAVTLLAVDRVPVRSTTVGLPATLLEMLTSADFAPRAGGVNSTPIEQVPLGATNVQVLPEMVNAFRLAPVSATSPTASVAVPVFVTVIASAALVVRTT